MTARYSAWLASSRPVEHLAHSPSSLAPTASEAQDWGDNGTADASGVGGEGSGVERGAFESLARRATYGEVEKQDEDDDEGVPTSSSAGWFATQEQQSSPPSYSHLRHPSFGSFSSTFVSPSSSAYAQHPPRQQPQPDVGGDFTFASAFDSPAGGGEVEYDFSGAVDPLDPAAGAVDPSSVSPDAEYFTSPALSGRTLFGTGAGVASQAVPMQRAQSHYGGPASSSGGSYQQQQEYASPSSSRGGSFFPSRPPQQRPGNYHSRSYDASSGALQDEEPSSPFQPFAFPPSTGGSGSAPGPYSGAPFPSTTSGGGLSFANLSSASVPAHAQVQAAQGFPLSYPGGLSSHNPGGFFPPSTSSGYRRHSVATASSAFSPVPSLAAPPSPPSSRSSILAGAFLPSAAYSASSPLLGVASPAVAAAVGVGQTPAQARFAGTPPLPGLLPSPPLTSSSSSAGKAKKRKSTGTNGGGGDAYSTSPRDDPDYAERMRHRPISPITGKPTKIIAKRSWPPKDQHKRTYVCSVEGCGKTFGRPSARDTHMRSHDGTKPFVCPIPSCARSFSVFSNLKRHMIVHPTVDFRHVAVHDLPLIQWVSDPNDPDGAGGRLEWIDQLPSASTGHSAQTRAEDVQGGWSGEEEMEE
ncbi:hypothetical protein JCM10213_008181 [Rhodosporidiobolus nylandii]